MAAASIRSSVRTPRWFTIVGVAKDVKQGGLDAPAGTELYFNYEQGPRLVGFAPRQMNLVLEVDAAALGTGALDSSGSGRGRSGPADRTDAHDG